MYTRITQAGKLGIYSVEVHESSIVHTLQVLRCTLTRFVLITTRTHHSRVVRLFPKQHKKMITQKNFKYICKWFITQLIKDK